MFRLSLDDSLETNLTNTTESLTLSDLKLYVFFWFLFFLLPLYFHLSRLLSLISIVFIYSILHSSKSRQRPASPLPAKRLGADTSTNNNNNGSDLYSSEKDNNQPRPILSRQSSILGNFRFTSILPLPSPFPSSISSITPLLHLPSRPCFITNLLFLLLLCLFFSCYFVLFSESQSVVTLMKGSYLLKYTRHGKGKPHKRYFRFNPIATSVSWSESEGSEKSKIGIEIFPLSIYIPM